MVMLDDNKNTTPSETITLVTDADGTPFDKPWEYASVVGIMMYLSRKYRKYIHYAVHQRAKFTDNPRDSHADALKRI